MLFWIVTGVIGGLTLLAVGFLVYVVIFYMPIIVKIFEDGQILRPPAVGERLEGEDVTFPATDGTPLAGVFVKGDEGNGRTILFCHEYGSDMHSLSKYGKFLVAKGFNVFAFNFRGHGASRETNGYEPRQWVTDKEIKDTFGAIRYLQTHPDVDPDRIGIFGVSRGAGSSICVASRCDVVKAIVADSAFSTELTLEKYMKKWVSIYAGVQVIYRNLPDWFYMLLGFICRKVTGRRLKCSFPSVERCARRVAPRPIYMIYGENDTYVGMAQAKDLFRRAGDPKDLWIVPGARHNESVSVAPEAYAKNVAEFFEKNL
ncbi:MAG: alpha/beta fold hydrolase [Planctomycetota bacterium]